MLTQAGWYAHPERDEFLQMVTLGARGRGRLAWGDSQVIRHDETIVYKVKALDGLGRFRLKFEGIALEYEDEWYREWEGEMQLAKGRWEFLTDGRFSQTLVFGYRLSFSHCPFFPAEEPSTLDYYGHHLES